MTINTLSAHPHYLTSPNTNEEVASDWPQPDYIFPQANTPLHTGTMSRRMCSSSVDEDEASVGSQSNDLDWTRYKEIIIKLYIGQNLSMRELIKTMAEKYNFNATKRMYHTRFAIWGVYKNTKAGTKSRLATNVVEAYRQKHKLPNLTDSEKRKLIRYSKTSKDLSKQDLTNLAQAISSMAEARQGMTGSNRNPGSDDEMALPIGAAGSVYTPSSDVTTAATSQTPPSSESSSGQRRGSSFNSVSLSPPLSFDRHVLNLELLLSCTRYYHEWQHNRAPLHFELNKKFWADIKSGIYFLKVGSHQLAWPLLRDAGEKVIALCEHRPPSLLADIYATISPTNTMVCPQLRVQLLRLFARTARTKLGINHPLTIICHQLQMDSDAETSVRALRLMIDDLEARSCHQKLDLHQLKRTLVTLLRRKKDYASAGALALSLVNSTLRDFGADNQWARVAETECVHILTDQGRWEEASKLCQAVLESGQRELGDMFPDERSVYAMEDMAEISGQLQLFEQALSWLEKAFDGAMRVWGPDHSTMHISNKLDRVRALKPDDLPSDLFWK